MTERDIENLLWDFPEKFFTEPLSRFARQPTILVGRCDLVFVDDSGALLIMEIKRGVLNRKVIAQLLDYESHYRVRYPDRTIRVMVVANEIFPERGEALKRLGFEWRAIPETKFVRVAEEIGYVPLLCESIRADQATRPTLSVRSSSTPASPSREHAVGLCNSVADLPATPERKGRLNPFSPGSFLFEVFEAARSGVSPSEIESLASKHGKGGVRFALANLQKGVRRQKGIRELTGKYGLVWDVHIGSIPLPINGTLGRVGPSDKILVSNVRAAIAERT